MLDKIWINAWQDMDQSLIPRLTTHKFGPRIFYKFKRGQYHHVYFFNLLRAVSVKPIFRIVGLNFVIFNWLQILGNIIWNKVIFKLPKISNIFARKNFKEYLKSKLWYLYELRKRFIDNSSIYFVCKVNHVFYFDSQTLR